jgi:hypothetical protein
MPSTRGSHDYSWEHRNALRGAGLLKAAADGGPPLPPTSDHVEIGCGRGISATEDVTGVSTTAVAPVRGGAEW